MHDPIAFARRPDNLITFARSPDTWRHIERALRDAASYISLSAQGHRAQETAGALYVWAEAIADACRRMDEATDA